MRSFTPAIVGVIALYIIGIARARERARAFGFGEPVRHNNTVASRFRPEPLTIPRIPNSKCTTFFYGHQRPGIHGVYDC